MTNRPDDPMRLWTGSWAPPQVRPPARDKERKKDEPAPAKLENSEQRD